MTEYITAKRYWSYTVIGFANLSNKSFKSCIELYSTCCKLLQTLILFDLLHWNISHKSSEIYRVLFLDRVYVDKCTIFDIHFGLL